MSNDENPKNVKHPWIPLKEILVLTGMVLGQILFMTWLSPVPIKPEAYRFWDLVSTILQQTGTVAIAFEVLRSKLASQQMAQYTEEFQRILENARMNPLPGSEHIKDTKLFEIKNI